MTQQNTQHFIEAFESIVAQYPDNDAVVTDGANALSYADLKQKALAIAHTLHAQGAGPETLIGLNIEKSSDYLASVLGCWYAGAAFMPLDPNLPEERRQYILDDSKVNIILSRNEHADLVEGNDRTVLAIEEIKGSAEQTSIALDRNLSDLAYVIYTSGSTGNPKGVEVTHEGLTPMLDAQIDAFQLGPKSRSLFYLSTNFDASVSDIGTALLSGAALHIENASAQDIATNLTKIIDERGISYMDIPPSMLRILDPQNAPASLKSITIGGEALDPNIAREWARKVRLVNVYGPTEATVCSSLCIIDPEHWDKPTIGQALPSVSYKVVDEKLNDVKAGESGELLIGGAQLARGYLSREDLNESKFIDLGGERFYRSGDKIKIGPNNELVFQGRIDRQVKIRGQLVELEEVEAKILQNSEIAQAAVLKRHLGQDGSGREALVAFVTTKDPEASLSAGEMKNTLSSSLSPWMIPSHIVTLPEMPQTATGKINFSALKTRAIDLTHVQQDNADHVLTDTEAQILDVWKKILELDEVKLDDDFYNIGGDSLASVELSLEAELAGLSITANLLNEKRTIREIAKHLDAHPDASADHITSDAMAADDLRQAVALDDEWKALIEQARTLPTVQNDTPKNIFLTGANGFLASRLMLELFTHSDTQIYALVRASDEEAALKRIEDAVKSQGLHLTDEMKARITPLCGDLTEPMMGLSEQRWTELASKIDTVIHSAAVVNMTAPYSKLYGPNVEGTKEAMKFALTGQKKKFHYASTLSVFVSTDQSTGDLLESDRLKNTKTVYGGYGQTKWAAEYFLHQIPADICDMSIHRLGLITGDTLTGKSAQKDFINMFVHGVKGLGAVPEGDASAIEVDITPIDYCCEALRHIILNKEPEQAEGHKVYHIANTAGFSLEQILNEIRWRGDQIDTLSPAVWKDKMNRMRKSGFSTQESAAYFAMSRILPGSDITARHTAMDLFQATGVQFNQINTQRALKGSNIALPVPDNTLLSTYIDSITGQKKSISKRGHQTMRKKTGLILGKFLPFHKGHAYLIDFAKKYPGVDKLYVVVDRTKDAPIPQAKRVEWIKTKFPDVTVLPLGDYNYQSPNEAPSDKEFWRQWERSLKETVPEDIDFVFNSEQYGWKLADALGARHVPVDRGRDNFPISGTQIRKDPFSSWEYLPEEVRPYFTKRVAIVGAESTGKSIMAKKLADYFNTVSVPEYARIYLESLAEKDQPRSTNYDDIEIFADGQMASETALTPMANRILISDTEPLTTQIWSTTLYPDKPVPASVAALTEEVDYDLYIVANSDVEWKPDMHRQWENESKISRRKAFEYRMLAELNARGKPHVIITGNDYDDRFEQAKEAIIQRVFKGRTFPDFGMK